MARDPDIMATLPEKLARKIAPRHTYLEASNYVSTAPMTSRLVHLPDTPRRTNETCMVLGEGQKQKENVDKLTTP